MNLQHKNRQIVKIKKEDKHIENHFIRKKPTITYIVQVGILAAISIVLYYFPKFSLPFFPSFLSVQFSMLPALIASFALGPVGGIIVVVIKFLFKVVSTRSAAIGEIADLIIGLAVVISAGFIYSFKRSKKGAFFAIITTIIVWCLVGVLINYTILIPAYVKMYGVNVVLGLLKKLPGVTADNYLIKYIVYACLPFNLMLSCVVSVVTLLIYKRISFLFEKMEK